MDTETQPNGHGQIYGLIAKIMKEVRPIAKGRRNIQQDYKFRGIDDVYEAVHPLFAEHGVFTIPRILAENTTERTTQSGTVLRFVNVSVAYDFFAPDGSHVTAEVIGEAMDSGDKASNKAMSAAHKYALIQTLCIPTGSTPDADYTTQPEVTGESRQVSKSNTAAQKCPDCGGAMWDNRETKKGNQPDYKCKSKSCNKAVWLQNQEPITEGYSEDQVLRDQYFKQAEKIMSGTEESRRKGALGRLLMLSTDEMGKRVAELSENVRRGGKLNKDEERELKIADIERDAVADRLDDYLTNNFPGLSLSQLDDAALKVVHDEFCIPF